MRNEERKERLDKKIRVNPALDKSDHDKLERLAYACRLSKAVRATKLLNICVNNPQIIDHIQVIYKGNQSSVLYR